MSIDILGMGITGLSTCRWIEDIYLNITPYMSGHITNKHHLNDIQYEGGVTLKSLHATRVSHLRRILFLRGKFPTMSVQPAWYFSNIIS